ncbi:hypothetical protein ET532_019875 [Verminephrobacter sp. Larva24]|nr:hypothetical protein ET532_019875 [Verminephrobacter sp. Larva24]
MTLFDFNYGLCFLVTSTLTNQSLAKKLPVIGAGQRMMLLKPSSACTVVMESWRFIGLWQGSWYR